MHQNCKKYANSEVIFVKKGKLCIFLSSKKKRIDYAYPVQLLKSQVYKGSSNLFHGSVF